MAKFDTYQQLTVHLNKREYPIFIGYDVLKDDNLLNQYLAGGQILIVTNDKVASLYLDLVKSAFTGKQCDCVILPDGEAFKNQHSLNSIYDKLITNKHHRDTTLIALGGGVIGDMTGFAAATYQRGVRFLQIPTTLLAQVDASIGGKTGINHPQGKNMIGSFHQPAAVIIDLNTLRTLPKREFRAGFAEVIKYALLAGGDFLQQVYAVLQAGLDEEQREHLVTVIKDCCQIKANYVEQDEFEQFGQRALLNLGHTFAHALESITHYERWLHGEAVAIGLYCAALLSHRCGLLDEAMVKLVNDMLSLAHLPRRIPRDVSLEAMRRAMSQDKKIKNKKLRFILMKAPGDCYIEEKVEDDLVFSVLQAAVEGD
ncbi:3-dehydroquinate synthase [Legionella jordanis]|uniref:3-dehydroquinate synthase n=1 Tax=Legionella jordanis TaxID=456 RepID=A0A0W0V8E8_9GAMM|nr:3-dehydroquinate synthase [Legionella jordanis]KTD16417.1 3-dehydroquinate synthase [Legionella jordanis]RMX04381.1 3-dehydroquinate synthase [Legionella jordanis]RMX15572.1 3-dehydroquinate synthase [Legionella jordanis]VEH12123.1 3-dehydroquinate synthase [Legionella jordanis]HAT8714980.1 3-dehydroquinate synthase [Legionella jordanis]